MTSVDGAVLEVAGLRIGISRGTGVVSVVDGVDLRLMPGELVGLVGESGSGKTLTALAIADLLPPGVEITGGTIAVDGTVITPELARSSRRLAMIFQNPMTSLNPSQRVGAQVVEALRKNGPRLSRAEAKTEMLRLLGQVELRAAERVARAYPHELSGGMRQRIMIAMALACDPAVLIADEPTTALDVTVQRGVMDLIERLRAELGLAVLLISHDLSLVAERCDRLLVMYAGEVVEYGRTTVVMEHSAHPYVEGLLGCSPERVRDMEHLKPLPGHVPRPGEVTRGCKFAPRCPLAFDKCFAEAPAMIDLDPGHGAKCHLYADDAPAGKRQGHGQGQVI